VSLPGRQWVVADPRFEGLEFDWLAVEGRGFVAIFSTARSGLVPLGFEPALHDAAIDAIAAGEATSAVVCAPVVAAGLRNLWRELAERGLYGFDAAPTGGPFRRVAIPSHPARVDALPSVVVAVATVLPEVSFGQAESVGRSEEPGGA
jgi:hypothetical protein